jgi:hypothetical protein
MFFPQIVKYPTHKATPSEGVKMTGATLKCRNEN